MLPEYQIVIVGVNAIQAKSLPENIIGIQGTENVQELVKIYSAADVFVNTTYEEVFGLVNIEALACGAPVVTYNSGGSPESISEDCGVVVPKGDLAQLSQGVKSIVNANGKYDNSIIRGESLEFKLDIKNGKYIDLFILKTDN